MNNNTSITINNKSNRLFLFFTLLLSLCFILKFLYFCQYGFDYTDESFYFNWSSSPFLYPFSVSQFGFILHPIYKLLNSNIFLFRISNVISLFLLSFLLGYTLLRQLYDDTMNLTTVIVYSSCFATSCFVYFNSWLITPSYNSLNLQALLIGAIGILIQNSNKPAANIKGWILIGISGWLTFMVKPTTTIVLGGLCLIANLGSLKSKKNLIFIALLVFSILTLISIYIIDGSISKFIHRLQGGLEYGNILFGSSGHTIFRLDNFRNSKVLFIVTCFLSLIFTRIVSSSNSQTSLYANIIIYAPVILCFYLLLTLNKIPLLIYQSKGLMLLALPFASAILLISSQDKLLNIRRELKQANIKLAVFFLLLPLTFTFGTGNNYWGHAGKTGIFWLASALILLTPIIQKSKYQNTLIVFPLLLFSQALSIISVVSEINLPYRQPQPLYQNASKTNVNNSYLILSEASSNTIKSWSQLAHKSGFKPNTPIIDLTGNSPGISYILNAKSIGQAWSLGGYPGSGPFLTASLEKAACSDLSKAWIIKPEATYPRRIPESSLEVLGIAFDEDYQLVGIVNDTRNGLQQPNKIGLYKPSSALEKKKLRCIS